MQSTTSKLLNKLLRLIPLFLQAEFFLCRILNFHRQTLLLIGLTDLGKIGSIY